MVEIISRRFLNINSLTINNPEHGFVSGAAELGWNNWLFNADVQGSPDLRKFSPDDSKAADEEITGIQYFKDDGRRIDHVVLPSKMSLHGIVRAVVYNNPNGNNGAKQSDQHNDIIAIPNLVEYEKASGAVSVINVVPSSEHSSNYQSALVYLNSETTPSRTNLTITSGLYTGIYTGMYAGKYAETQQHGDVYLYDASSDNSLSGTSSQTIFYSTQLYSSASHTNSQTLEQKPSSSTSTQPYISLQPTSLQPYTLLDQYGEIQFEKTNEVSNLEYSLEPSLLVTVSPATVSSEQVLSEQKSQMYTTLFIPSEISLEESTLQVHEPTTQVHESINLDNQNFSVEMDDPDYSVQTMSSAQNVSATNENNDGTHNNDYRAQVLLGNQENSLTVAGTVLLEDLVIKTGNVRTAETDNSFSDKQAEDSAKQDLSLRSVVRDGKTLQGIEALFENYVVTKEDLSQDGKYLLRVHNIVSQQGETYRVPENSLLAIVDKYLHELGAENVEYEMHTFTVQGKKLTRVLLKDVDGIIGDNYDLLKHGFAIFVDGKEPGNGTINLEEYIVKEGAKVSLAVIDQNTYRGDYNSEKASSTRCIMSSGVVDSIIFQQRMQDTFGLKAVEINGKTLEGILTMINEYQVTGRDLNFDRGNNESKYTVTATNGKTEDGKEVKTYVDINPNSALAVIDRLLGQLGANPQYKMTRFAAGGKIVNAVELRGIFEYDKHANEVFGVGDNTHIGMLGFINGEEPGKGTVPLHEAEVNAGDKISLAYVNQGVYRGDFNPDKRAGSVCTVEGTRNRIHELQMDDVFRYRDMIVREESSGIRAVGVINRYVIQEQDIVSTKTDYYVNAVVNRNGKDTTTEINVAGNSVLAVLDQMLYRNKIGLNIETRVNDAGQLYNNGIFETNADIKEKLGSKYAVKAVVDGKMVDDLITTTVSAGQEVSIVYVASNSNSNNKYANKHAVPLTKAA